MKNKTLLESKTISELIQILNESNTEKNEAMKLQQYKIASSYRDLERFVLQIINNKTKERDIKFNKILGDSFE